MHERIRVARKYAKLTQEHVASKCGVSRNAVTHWESLEQSVRTIPSIENLKIISRITGAPLMWLLSDSSTISQYWLDDVGDAVRETSHEYENNIAIWDTPDDLPPGEFIMVPKLDVHAAAGNGCINDDWPINQKKIAFRSDYIRDSKARSNKLVAFEIDGDSMMPTLMNNDTVIADLSQNEISNGLVYAFVKGSDGVFVKRLYKHGNMIIIESDNRTDPKYKYPEELKDDDSNNVKIIGRIVHRGGSGGL